MQPRCCDIRNALISPCGEALRKKCNINVTVGCNAWLLQNPCLHNNMVSSAYGTNVDIWSPSDERNIKQRTTAAVVTKHVFRNLVPFSSKSWNIVEDECSTRKHAAFSKNDRPAQGMSFNSKCLSIQIFWKPHQLLFIYYIMR